MNKNMKMILSIVLFGLLVFSVAGCGKKDEQNTKKTPEPVTIKDYMNRELSKIRTEFDDNNIKVEVVHDEVYADSEIITSQSANVGDVLKPGDTITFHVTTIETEEDRERRFEEEMEKQRQEMEKQQQQTIPVTE